MINPPPRPALRKAPDADVHPNRTDAQRRSALSHPAS